MLFFLFFLCFSHSVIMVLLYEFFFGMFCCLISVLSFMFNVKNFKVPFFTFCSFFLVHLYLEIKMLVNFTSKVEFSNFPANITSNFEVSFFCFFFFFCCWRGQCRIIPGFYFFLRWGLVFHAAFEFFSLPWVIMLRDFHFLISFLQLLFLRGLRFWWIGWIW